MIRVIRSKLTFSNVVSLLALFIALGGTSYAVAKLPKNSVGGAQLRKNSVTGAKVKNRSLTGSDFKLGQLPAGAVGPTGPQGEPGPSAGYQKALKTTVTNLPNYFSNVLAMSVPPGNYFVTATVEADTLTGTPASVDCRLINGPGGAGSDAVTRGMWIAGVPALPPFPVQTMSLSAEFTIPADATAAQQTMNIDCEFSAPTTVRIGEANISAVRIASITGTMY